MHTNHRMQTYWEETQAYVRGTWPKITEGDLKKINGSYDAFLLCLREYYGHFPLTEAQARDKLKAFYNGLDEKRGVKAVSL
ncbi:MAG: hypothetical protein HQM16_18945 [Deltaproteobacteria bacterium]|nr:hypothetical protein [Deltaproteobacteria bacterium]